MRRDARAAPKPLRCRVRETASDAPGARVVRLACLAGALAATSSAQLGLWAATGSVAVVTAGCGAPAPADRYLDAMAEGRRAYNAGRYADAQRAYLDAEQVATRVKDRDEAIFMQARMRELVGDSQGAQERYRHLVAVSPTGPRTVRAIFELAELELEHGDPARGWAGLEAALVSHPNHGSARRAFSRVMRHIAQTSGEPAARAFAAGAQATFVGTEAEQQALYEVAQSWERAGQLERARDGYIALAEKFPYPRGSLTDDAYWRAAVLEERLGHYHQAIALLQKMVASKEWDFTGSSYERPRFPKAQLRIAEIYRDKLHDVELARRAFHAIYENHGESAGADDALWQEALLARGAGDTDDACALVQLIVDDYPSSRYLRCADRMCESEPALDPERRGCPPYIARALTGEPDLAADELDEGGAEPEDGSSEVPLGSAIRSE